MKIKVSSIIGALPGLSQRDLATVRAAADHLLSQVPPDSDVIHSDETTHLFDALTGLLSMRLSYAAFCKPSGTYRQWRQNAADVVAFINETFPTAKERVVRHALMVFILEGLMDDLKARKIPITLGTMIVHLARVPAVFDDAFPDYRKAGLAPLLLKSMKVRS